MHRSARRLMRDRDEEDDDEKATEEDYDKEEEEEEEEQEEQPVAATTTSAAETPSTALTDGNDVPRGPVISAEYTLVCCLFSHESGVCNNKTRLFLAKYS